MKECVHVDINILCSYTQCHSRYEPYDCTRLLLSTPTDDQHLDDNNLGEMEGVEVRVVAVEVLDEKSDDGRERGDVQKDEDEGQNDKDVRKDEDKRQNDIEEHRGRKGSREPPHAIPITNISNEVEKVKDSPGTPCTESGPSKAVYVTFLQESSIDARFDARQQQVVGSLNKETREVRESPDGCNQ